MCIKFIHLCLLLYMLCSLCQLIIILSGYYYVSMNLVAVPTVCFFDKFCDTAPLGERALDKVEHRFADTRLLWTPCYYRQFSLSLGKVRNIFSNFNPLNAVAC